MKCDGESIHAAQQQNRSTATPFHRLDSSLFYSSPQSDVSEPSITSASAAGRGIYDEYRVDTPDSGLHAGLSPTLVFTLSDVTDGVDCHLLRTVFLLSDLVVLVYRLTVTYVTVLALRRRFDACTVRRRPTSCPPAGQGGVVAGRQAVADGGSMLRSSTSRTALTSTSGTGAVQDASNIYIDPQSLVVENCATLLSRPLSNVDTSASCPRRHSDAKYPPGQLMVFWQSVRSNKNVTRRQLIGRKAIRYIVYSFDDCQVTF